MNTYQIMPNLTADEADALRESIRCTGIQIPVVVDETGSILDGHHRVAIADELGIEYPTVVAEGLSEEQKIQRVIDLNVARRHLTPDQRKEVIQQLRKLKLSYRAIGNAVGGDAATAKRAVDAGVANATPDGEDDGAQPEEPATVVGRDGKTYSSRRSPQATKTEPGFDDGRPASGARDVPKPPPMNRRTLNQAIRAELDQLRGCVFRFSQFTPEDLSRAVSSGDLTSLAMELLGIADTLGTPRRRLTHVDAPPASSSGDER